MIQKFLKTKKLLEKSWKEELKFGKKEAGASKACEKTPEKHTSQNKFYSPESFKFPPPSQLFISNPHYQQLPTNHPPIPYLLSTIYFSFGAWRLSRRKVFHEEGSERSDRLQNKMTELEFNMKYAHLADLHLGSWRDPTMRELSTKAFLQALDLCQQQQVDFILFAGDIFNTSLPAIDTLKIVTKKLKELKDKDVPLYVIAGSHDFSPSGKTMIDVLEHAGLLINVCKGHIDQQQKLHLHFTVDKKTGAKMTGILGRKGQLDAHYYQDLAREPLEQEQGYKIFMFHTSISELKPKHLEQIESQPASFLPKGFNYYAGGHIHHRTEVFLPDYGTLTYPGALFPNNFAEVEKYSRGGFYVVTVEKEAVSGKQQAVSSNTLTPLPLTACLSSSTPYHSPLTPLSLTSYHQTLEWLPVQVIKHQKLYLNCSRKTPEVIEFELLNAFHQQDLQDTMVTLRLSGLLQQGRVSDINFKKIHDQLAAQGAVVVMKNTAELSTEEFEEIKIAETSPEEVEEKVLQEQLQQLQTFEKETELHLCKSLLSALNTTKKEGETSSDFQQRLCQEAEHLLFSKTREEKEERV